MISIISLSKSYAGKPALDNVSLTVARGETVVILGHSGSGKSTLLRCLIGLARFESGFIQVDDIRVDPAMSTESRRSAIQKIRHRCGTVFQQYHLFPHLTILENITLAPVHAGRISSAKAQASALELLHNLGLESKASHRPHQLSGGEQQRVAIARALALDPHYLLYDEPTSALDPPRARDMWKLMANLAEKGQTQIIVTHQEQIQDALPCRIVRMEKGKIVEVGVTAG